MKRPVYKISPAHSGEYEGATVEKEKERILNLLPLNPQGPTLRAGV